MIESAEVFYQADDEYVTLKLKLDDDDVRVNNLGEDPFFRFLTPAAYKQLWRSIRSIECDICGGDHPDFFHGAVILSLDTGHAPAWQDMGDQIGACEDLLDNQTEKDLGYHAKMWGLLNEWKADARKPEPEQEMDFGYFDTKMSEIMSEAGYVIVNSSDAGAWMIYAAYDGEPE